MDACYVGIDVLKDRLDAHAHPAGTAFSTARKGAGLEELVGRLKALEPALVAIEATGGFETVVAAALADAGLPVVVVNPAQVRHFAQALGKRAKTDPIDAAVIAHFAEAPKPELRPLPDATTHLLADLVGRRKQIVEMMAAEGQRERRLQASAQEHRPAAQGAREGTRRTRRRDRRARARVACLGGKGRPARLRSRRRPDHRPHG
jgi:transposase